MPGMQRSSLWYLQNTPVFSMLPESVAARVSASVERSTHPPRQRVLLADSGDRVFFVVAGAAKLGRRGFLGRRVVETIVQQGDLFGSLSASGTGRSFIVEPIEPLTLLAVPSEIVERCIREHPECALTVIQTLEDQHRKLQRNVESLLFKDLTTRVIEVVLWLAREHGDRCEHGWAVDVRVNQQDLADLCGATRQAVSGVLRKLERRFILRRTGRVICILSMRRLSNLVQSNDDEK